MRRLVANRSGEVGGPAESEDSAGSWRERRAAADEWEHRHETEWVRIDQQLRDVAARRAALDAEEARLLRYAEELKLWRGYGCGSMIEYMERAMGYAPHTANERLRVARMLGELSLIAEALEQGELMHSAVRELSRVAIPDTESAWLEAARGKSLRQIEAMVSGRKPGDLPSDETEPRLHRRTITIELSPESYDLWRQMHALAAEEHGQRLSDDELVPSVFRRAYGDGGQRDGRTPAYKIAIKQCPDCKRAWQYGGGRDIEIDPAGVACASCDAVHLGSLDSATPERATTTVTARKREQVLARDGYCCTVPGCRRNVGLDLHHIQLQSRGGSHDLRNLTTLCSLHHKALHYGGLLIQGTAPDHLTFELRGPRDRRNVTDDDANEPPHTRPDRVNHQSAMTHATPSRPSARNSGAAGAGRSGRRSDGGAGDSARAAAPGRPAADDPGDSASVAGPSQRAAGGDGDSASVAVPGQRAAGGPGDSASVAVLGQRAAGDDGDSACIAGPGQRAAGDPGDSARAAAPNRPAASSSGDSARAAAPNRPSAGDPGDSASGAALDQPFGQ